jgi:hypothetical protein
MEKRDVLHASTTRTYNSFGSWVWRLAMIDIALHERTVQYSSFQIWPNTWLDEI